MLPGEISFIALLCSSDTPLCERNYSNLRVTSNTLCVKGRKNDYLQKLISRQQVMSVLEFRVNARHLSPASS